MKKYPLTISFISIFLLSHPVVAQNSDGCSDATLSATCVTANPSCTIGLCQLNAAGYAYCDSSAAAPNWYSYCTFSWVNPSDTAVCNQTDVNVDIYPSCNLLQSWAWYCQKNSVYTTLYGECGGESVDEWGLSAGRHPTTKMREHAPDHPSPHGSQHKR